MKEAQGHQVKPSWAQGLQGPHLLYRCDRLVVETVLLVEIPLTPLPSAKPLPEPMPKLLPRPNPEQFPNPPPMPPALTPPPTTAAGETKDMVIPSVPATRSLSPKLSERMARAGGRSYLQMVRVLWHSPDILWGAERAVCHSTAPSPALFNEEVSST